MLFEPLRIGLLIPVLLLEHLVMKKLLKDVKHLDIGPAANGVKNC
jgi:hypothetical protein